jgi:hypothetical protein
MRDQDLWRWKLPRSREVNAAIASHPQRFEVWDQLAAAPIELLAEQGSPIVRAATEERRHDGAADLVTDLRIDAVNATPTALIATPPRRAAHGTFTAPYTGVRANTQSALPTGSSTCRLAVRYGGGGHQASVPSPRAPGRDSVHARRRSRAASGIGAAIWRGCAQGAGGRRGRARLTSAPTPA